jgi:hypothetical protein
MRRRYRQDPKTGKLHEITQDSGKSHSNFISIADVNFVSPIDGSHIRNIRELNEHNKRHGVSNDLDSLREQTAKEMGRHNRPFSTSRERKEAINDAIERVSSSGFRRNIQYDQ